MTEAQHEAAAHKRSHSGDTKRPSVIATVDGERFLTYGQVEAITTYHRATIYTKVRNGDFPKPVRLGPNRVGFRETEVAKWMRDREAYQPAKSPNPRVRGSSEAA
jgi:prophage regulatory protein